MPIRPLNRWLLRAVGVAVLLSAFTVIPDGIRSADVHFFGESVRDRWGALRWSERWQQLPRLSPTLDYGWLADGAAPLLVGHALGAWSRENRNSLDALEAALDAGFTLLELDVWLDEAGRLRCHHGPQPPAAWRDGDCDLQAVLLRMRGTRARLILDLKTDFVTTGEKVMAALGDQNDSRRVIFQLYLPEHVVAFDDWSRRVPLLGPIVSVYQSHRSVNHVAAGIQRSGVRALVVPLYRLPALGEERGALFVLTHPVGTCDAVEAARRGKARGLFVSVEFVAAETKGCLLQ